MTVEILEAMSESVVATKAGLMIKQALADARRQENAAQTSSPPQFGVAGTNSLQRPGDALNSSIDNMLTSQLPFSSIEPVFGYEGMGEHFPLNEALFMFSADWDNGIGGFGA